VMEQAVGGSVHQYSVRCESAALGTNRIPEESCTGTDGRGKYATDDDKAPQISKAAPVKVAASSATQWSTPVESGIVMVGGGERKAAGHPQRS